MKTNQTKLTAIVAAMLLCGSAGYVNAQNSIQDSDNDTRVETARTGDDDVIRFRSAGVDRLQITGQRIEPLNTGNSIFLGSGAGRDDNLSNNNNAFIGTLAGQRNVNGQLNTAIGFSALRLNINNSNNTAIGPSALLNLTAGTTNNANTAIGPRALDALTGGNSNLGIGTDAGGKLVNGSGNTMLGHAVGGNKTGGSFNTLLGTGAGSNNAAGSNNVMIGYLAGANEAGSNKLYIANSNTADPLIGGDFSAGTLEMNARTTIRAGAANAVDIYGSSTGSYTRYYTAAGTYRGLVGALNNGDMYVRSGTGEDVQIQTGGTTRIFADASTGNVGMGTTTPSAKLEVESTGGATDPQLKLTQSGTSSFSRLRFEKSSEPTKYFDIAASPNGTGAAVDMNFFYNDGTTGVNVMTIEGDDEQVGIGTTNPTNGKLVITSNASSGQAQLRLVEDAAAGYARLQFDNVNSNTRNWQIQTQAQDGATPGLFQIAERASGSDSGQRIHFHIDGNTDNVGIGNDSPEALLEIAGDNTISKPTLRLTENGVASANPVRLQMGSSTTNKYFAFAAKPDATTAVMNLNYNNGTGVSSAITIDGTNKRIGISNENPTEDLHIGTSTGATIKFGSFETISDGGSATIEVNSNFQLETSGSEDLGTSTKQWRNAYLTGSVLFVPPSGGGTNSRGTTANAPGLEEILALQTTTYDVAQADGSTAPKYAVTLESLRENIDALVVDKVLERGLDKEAESDSFNEVATENTAIDQLGLIPVLVQAVQEQNQQVADLQEENAELSAQLEQLATIGVASEGLEQMLADLETTKAEIEQLKADLMACCSNSSGNTPQTNPVGQFSVTPQQLDVPGLEQNSPNPFASATQIKYYLPTGMEGELVVTDNFGREIGRYRAIEGTNMVTLEGGQLVSGTYSYSLVVEGRAIDTKQMVITK